MQSPVSHASVALLAAGAVSVLLLGAFSPAEHPAPLPEPTPVVIQETQPGPPAELALPDDISPQIGEIAKLARAHVDEIVIFNYIRNSGQNYAPSANEILYLTDLGLSKKVLLALYKEQPKPAPVVDVAPVSKPEIAVEPTVVVDPAPVIIDLPPESAPKPRPVGVSQTKPLMAEGKDPGLFYTALAPYGDWLQLPKYGQVWQPAVALQNPEWRPYVNEGRWQYTENGWYWQSGYKWGWAPFHYGRWQKGKELGWVWIPDKTWGPGWVCWRTALDHFGWAPLAPGVSLAESGGLKFKNMPVAANYDLGLPAAWYIFVQKENFLQSNLPSYALPNLEAAGIYRDSQCANNYFIVNHKIINGGPTVNHGLPEPLQRKTAFLPPPTVRTVAELSPERPGRSYTSAFAPVTSKAAASNLK